MQRPDEEARYDRLAVRLSVIISRLMAGETLSLYLRYLAGRLLWARATARTSRGMTRAAIRCWPDAAYCRSPVA